MTSTAITVVDRRTGEQIDVVEAETETLAAFVVNAAEIHAELKDAESLVSDELVRRLDRGAAWTLRLGDPKSAAQFEVTSPSPEAGTVVFDPRALHAELVKLIAARTITAEAARAAQKRSLIVELQLPYQVDLDEIAKTVQGAIVTVAGVEGQIITADPSVTNVVGGIKKLQKVPGTGAALLRASVRTTPPARRAKVTVKTKEAACR